MTPRIWLIAGPTASGKSALALKLARALDGEIVNADSMQLYADLRPLGHALAARGITDSVALEEWLPAALGGHRFGDDPRALHVRLATSALYGATPREREAALHAPDPLRVPHVAAAVAELGRAFTDVTAGSPTVRS